MRGSDLRWQVGLALTLLAVAAPSMRAQGHGPIYGLSTPTLGRGAWSVDVAAMGRVLDGAETAMLRPMVSYGLTEDLQLSISLPVPLYTTQGTRPVRGATRMPMLPDMELLLGWRFHRVGTDVGARFESTLWLGLDYPTDENRDSLATAPGVVGALATGYASRSVYVWVGGLYRRYVTPSGDTADHPGDLAMASLVLGYRPSWFRKELPHPDWRVFVELIAEHTERDVIAGKPVPGSGGGQIFVGPTLLGLFGAWGVSGGPLWRVWSEFAEPRPSERVRLAVNYTYWF